MHLRLPGHPSPPERPHIPSPRAGATYPPPAARARHRLTVPGASARYPSSMHASPFPSPPSEMLDTAACAPLPLAISPAYRYIEASKTRLYQTSLAGTAQAVLLYIFENILKLLHSFMPFVTEELWQALPCRRQALIISHWPQTSLPRDANSVKRFENLQSLIRAIRNARAEYSVEPAKRISASVVANTDVLAYISSEKQVLAHISCTHTATYQSEKQVHFRESPPDYAKQSIHLVAGEGLEAYLPLVDMVDISLEVQRLAKRLSKMQSEYDALASRLNSPSCLDLALLP